MSNIESGPRADQDNVESLSKSELLERYDVELCEPTDVLWEKIGKDILNVEVSSFGKEKSFDQATLKRDFENQKNTIILIKSKEIGAIIGFTYAKPTIDTYPEDFPKREAAEDTAYIYDTAIEKSHRGKGLLPLLSEKLENELTSRGFAFIERDSANTQAEEKLGDETYADKIRKSYQGRIIKEEPHDSEYGPQVFFRISLSQPK